MLNKSILLITAAIGLAAACSAQPGPDVTSRILNTSSATGYAGSYIMNVKNDAITYTEKIIITH